MSGSTSNSTELTPVQQELCDFIVSELMSGEGVGVITADEDNWMRRAGGFTYGLLNGQFGLINELLFQTTYYLTGKGVTVFDKTGKKVEQIDVPEPWTANVCFGGKDKKTLFITASKKVYGVKMRVKGAN